MKILSIYLPGFHEDELNNKAWGKGFTEWDNVKTGKKLYKDHIQPIVPLNNNYYDLSNVSSIENQVKLAKEYGVDGFIMYHYWFGNNTKALYKPAEIYRDEAKEKIDYCFCWANHTWIKNWHDNNLDTIAVQEYGSEEDWIDHINYLIPFFEDEHYIKINGRPLLYIYNASDMKCMASMIDTWNSVLKEKGISELYIVEYISSKNREVSCEKTDAVVEFEPLYTTFFDVSPVNLFRRFICKKLNLIDFQDYNKLWKKIINRKRQYGNLPIQKGCFSAWDNSARKGYNGMIVKNSCPENFYNNLKALINNNRKNATNDFVVINAWNEWSEGAILEPTENDKYGYLEAIKRIKEDYSE